MSNEHSQPSEIPVVILCGGRGVRMGEATNLRPKPLIEVNRRPIIFHIMRLYARHGFRRFVLCLGYKGTMIEEYFRQQLAPADWQITFAHTGDDAQTGARVSRIANYIDADLFMLTYGDGLSDIDIGATVSFHRAHGCLGTISATRPPSQFGELQIDGHEVRGFAEKPQRPTYINGGFFVFNKKFLSYLDPAADCILERQPLERLATEGGLRAFRHEGFWQCLDTPKDREILEKLCKDRSAPWLAADEYEAPQPVFSDDLKLKPTRLKGAYVLETTPREDERGSFSRVYCQDTFDRLGLETAFVQHNHSCTLKRGTIRGLHYQRPPYAETKLIRCVRGAIFDVMVDLRQDSPTFGEWHGEVLTSDNSRLVYVPPGFAHGFQALTDNAEVTYPSSSRYSSLHEGGICFDDPVLNIEWPVRDTPFIVSDKDRNLPRLIPSFRGIDL